HRSRGGRATLRRRRALLGGRSCAAASTTGAARALRVSQTTTRDQRGGGHRNHKTISHEFLLTCHHCPRRQREERVRCSALCRVPTDLFCEWKMNGLRRAS